MKVTWTDDALKDRADIWDFIAADNPGAASALDQLFDNAVDQLVDFPLQGRAGRAPGTREWVIHSHYLLIYEIKGDYLLILALLHTARLWPRYDEIHESFPAYVAL